MLLRERRLFQSQVPIHPPVSTDSADKAFKNNSLDAPFTHTVELRSKGPATKGNRSLRDNGAQSRLSPFSFLLFGAPARWDTAIRETSLFGKDFSVPRSCPKRFLDASLHLYMRVCPCVRMSVSILAKPPKTRISACETHLIACRGLFLQFSVVF